MATLQSPETFRFTLEMPPEMMRLLEQIARESNQPMESVITRAIALYKASLDAMALGKHVGFSGSTEDLEVEFIGMTPAGGK